MIHVDTEMYVLHHVLALTPWYDHRRTISLLYIYLNLKNVILKD